MTIFSVYSERSFSVFLYLTLHLWKRLLAFPRKTVRIRRRSLYFYLKPNFLQYEPPTTGEWYPPWQLPPIICFCWVLTVFVVTITGWFFIGSSVFVIECVWGMSGGSAPFPSVTKNIPYQVKTVTLSATNSSVLSKYFKNLLFQSWKFSTN